MEILIGICVYSAITVVIVRFVQGVHSRDEDMRDITARWIQEKKNSPVSH